MKRQFKSTLFILLFLCSALNTNAQWRRTASFPTTLNIEYVWCLAQTMVSYNGIATYYQYAGTNGGVFISTNYGDSWTKFNTGLNSQDLNIKSINSRGSLIYAAGFGGVFKSTNLGLQWSSIASYENGFTVYASPAMVINDPYLYAASLSTGVFKSTDAGTSWQAINTGLPKIMPQINSLLLTNNSGAPYIYTATNSGIFVLPTNSPQWYYAGNGIPPSTMVYSLAAKGTTMLAGTSTGLYISSNMGAMWYQVSGAPVYTFYCFAVYGNYIFAGTAAGIYLSYDSGYNWTKISTGSAIEYTTIYSIGVFQNYLIAGTYQMGVWKRLITDILGNVSVEKESLPNEFELKQNYPNPFNPSTIIEYTVPTVETPYMAPQHITIKIYDVLGREIKTLVDDYKMPGVYSIQFTAENLPSGIYYYVLYSGSNRLTKKMTLIK